MRRLPINAFIGLLAIIFTVAGWRLFAKDEAQRFHAVDAVRKSQSYVAVSMRIAYPTGSIEHEEYRLINDNGVSRAIYSIGNRKGTIATFSEDIQGFDVTFTFEKLVRDGIWQLNSKRPRSPDAPRYVVHIEQTAQQQSGHRTITFTSPNYWALTAGRQYHIELDPRKATPTQADLLRLESTAVADPRYLEIVDDFTTFGSATFHRTIASARERVLRS